MATIRKATLNDARALSGLAEKTFRDAFGALNAAEDMDAYCLQAFGEAAQAREISSLSRATFLSEEEDRLVGFAQVRWDAAPNCVSAASPGEIQRLYVVSEQHGKGAARDLMRACIEELKRRGSDVAWLGVWERNLRAISFYRKIGFVEVGDHVFLLGRDPQRDIVMVRRIEDAPSAAPPVS